MEGKSKDLDVEGKRISRRRTLIHRTLKKQQEKLDNQEEVHEQILTSTLSLDGQLHGPISTTYDWSDWARGSAI